MSHRLAGAGSGNHRFRCSIHDSSHHLAFRVVFTVFLTARRMVRFLQRMPFFRDTILVAAGVSLAARTFELGISPVMLIPRGRSRGRSLSG